MKKRHYRKLNEVDQLKLQGGLYNRLQISYVLIFSAVDKESNFKKAAKSAQEIISSVAIPFDSHQRGRIMIVANAQIAMASSHEYREEHKITEKLDFWLTAQAKTQTQNGAQQQDTPQKRWDEQVYISARGFSLLELQRSQTLNLNNHLDARSRINLMILQKLYEAITGHSMQLMDPSDLQSDTGTQTLQVDATPPSTDNSPPVESAGYGMVYQRNERYQEQEKLQFQAQGVVRTTDGREINFSASLAMSRNYVEESNLIIRAGDATKIDPLVINFDGKGAGLNQSTFDFDIDSNGTEEQLASLRTGSGFLALDRNGDGRINNGTELFGPASGKGFAELAKFDEDGNHFIDEGDSIYNKLRIWAFNEDGSSQLMALGDKQIGAIFLGHLTTPFQLKDESNKSLGEVASSGIYLKEDGQTGVVQEINLSV